MEVAAKKESNNLVIFLIGELDEYTAPYTRTGQGAAAYDAAS